MDDIKAWVASLALLAFLVVFAIGFDVVDKHGSNIANNIGNKVEAWTK